jgi:hypothetical protein
VGRDEVLRNGKTAHAIRRIRISTREHEVNDRAVEALAADPDIYQRGEVLVHVIRTERDEESEHLRRPAGSPQIRVVPMALLRDRLTAVVEFEKFDGRCKEYVLAHPPDWCVKAVEARGQWDGIRHLEGVVDVPVLRPDGTLLDRPGYDEMTRLLYLPKGPAPIVPDRPTTNREVRVAVRVLMDLVTDFPFKKREHCSAWLAHLETPLARPAFDGPAPMTVYDGNVAGAGKGLLCSMVSTITTGQDMPVSAAHSDDNEMRKAITAAAIAGDQLIVLDNVAGVLGGPALDAALTTTRWRARLLGGNKWVDLPLYATWAATGNNIILGGDTARRVLHVRLESPEEHPEERTDFKHPDLRSHARQHRAELLAAALTILRAYCAAGRPDMNLPPWGSFESWSALVRGAIVWAGEVAGIDLPDPAATRDEVRRNADPAAQALPALLAGIETLDPKGEGLTVGEILSRSEQGEEPAIMALREALCILCPSKDGKVSPNSLGMKLHHQRGRVIGGRCLQRLESRAHANGTRWRVVSTAQRGD